MIRILHIVPGMNRGGMETYLMNLYRKMDRQEIQFDFLIHHTGVGCYEEEIRRLGGRICHIPSRHENGVANRRELDRFFREHPEYRVVIQHVSSLSYTAPLKAAASAGVPVRLFHCHNVREGGSAVLQPLHRFLHWIHGPRAGWLATDFCACSLSAAEFLTSKRTYLMSRLKMMPNVFDTADFSWTPSVRASVRAELGVEEKTLLVGNVGRLVPQKNQTFLIRMVLRMRDRYPDTRLLLMGSGEGETALKSACRELHMERAVIFAGEREDIRRYYQAMDIFVFPSLYEGLGMAVLEARAAGLPCLLSERVPEEVRSGEAVKVLELKAGETVWALKALEMVRQYGKIRDRLSRKAQKELAPYDAARAAGGVEAYYKKLAGRSDGSLHILQVRMDEEKGAGGISAYILGLFRQMKDPGIRFDFLMPVGSRCACAEEIAELGGTVYPVFVRKRDGLREHFISLSQFYAAHPEIKVIHGHYGQMHSLAEYTAACRAHVPARIFHAHSTDQEPSGLRTKIQAGYHRFLIPRCSNVLLACSDQAGKALYGKHRFQTVSDGIETERFAYDQEKRRQIRKELGIDSRRVIGHAGRFVWQKNHDFLLEIFADIHKKDRKTLLMLIGEGELRAHMERKVRELRLEGAVLFLGQRKDMEKLYLAMDMFLLPSHYEGLGMVLLEAQASGLPCIASSEAVPEEVKVLDSFRFLSLDAGCEVWAEAALEALEETRGVDGAKKVSGAGYESRMLAAQMEQLYLGLAGRKETE